MPWLSPPPADFRARLKAVPPAPDEAFAALKKLAEHSLDLDQLAQLSRALGKHAGLAASKDAAHFRLAILGNYTTHYLADVLPASALRHGVVLKVFETPYDQLPQQVFEPDTALKKSGCDAVLLAIDHRQLGITGSLVDVADAERRTRDIVALLGSLAEEIGRSMSVPCILNTLPQAPDSLTGGFDAVFAGSQRSQIARVNEGIRNLCGVPGRALVDFEFVAAGIGLARWHDARLWQSAKLPLSLDAIPLAAEHVARVIGALRGKSRKCLVLDLDNTLWGGVIGDDGLEGIQMANGSAVGEAFRALQQYALTLRARGVILAVASKNTEEVALRAFREHPDMLIKESDVAVFLVNWDDKATNLAKIARTLNIGIDSLVFVDDNPAERARVRQMLPQVAVPELPEDPATYAELVAAAGYFEALSISPEDLQRAGFYQDNAQRAAEMGKLGSMDEYHRSLQMVCTLAPFDAIGRARIAQLINKSNQYNLTTRRYTEAQVEAVESDPSRYHLQVRLADKFGDNGMISVVVFDKAADAWTCDTWLMSCRVLGRRVEEAVLRQVALAAVAEGAAALIGHYIPSAKNAMVAEHYGKLGFTRISDDAGGGSTWRLELAGYVAPDLPMTLAG